MANECDDRESRIRAAAAEVVKALCAGMCMQTDQERARLAMVEALLLANARPGVAAAEHDERTRDLEALAEERDACTSQRDRAMAERDRAQLACALAKDATDTETRAHATTKRILDGWIARANDAETRATYAVNKLASACAMIDELRSELAAPTAHSAAVEAWRGLTWESRGRVLHVMRRDEPEGNEWQLAADVLDSLSMGAPSDEDERVGTTTDAANENERLRGEVQELSRMLDAERTKVSTMRLAFRRVLEIA